MMRLQPRARCHPFARWRRESASVSKIHLVSIMAHDLSTACNGFLPKSDPFNKPEDPSTWDSVKLLSNNPGSIEIKSAARSVSVADRAASKSGHAANGALHSNAKRDSSAYSEPDKPDEPVIVQMLRKESFLGFFLGLLRSIHLLGT